MKKLGLLMLVIGTLFLVRAVKSETIVVRETFIRSIILADTIYRGFDESKKPLKLGVIGTSTIACDTETNEWNESGSKEGIVWDGDTPRFLTDAEKCVKCLVSAHAQIDAETDALMFDTDFEYTYGDDTYTFNTSAKDTYFQDYFTLDTEDYPHVVKANGPNFFTFATQADHLAFIKYGANVIRDIVTWGTCLKYGGTYDSVVYIGIYNMTYEQLKGFKDPRSGNE